MKVWKSLVRFLKMRRINQQIFFLMIFTITIPLVIISIIVYFSSLQSVKNEYEESSNLILNNLSFNMDQYLQSIETSTLGIYMENDFQATLENWSTMDVEKDSYQGLQYENALERFIRSIDISMDHVESVQIYTDNRIFYSTLFSHSIVSVNNANRSKKYNQVLDEKGDFVLFGTHKPILNPDSDEDVITIGRAINKKGSKQSLGVLFIDIRIDAIRDILSLSENSDRNFVILDEKGGVIYASDEQIIDDNMNLNESNQDLLHTLDQDFGSFYTNKNEQDTYVNYVTSPYSDWKVIQYIDRKEMTRQAEKMRKIMLILVLSSIITAALFMLILNRRVTKPIMDLSDKVEQVGQGNLNVKLDSDRQDEFGMLYQEISHMARELKGFIERSSMLKAQHKLAQYSALKSQIHPHFLANALETIQMKAIINDQEDISEMISVLGQLFRISIQSGKEVVTLEEELKHTRLYVKVQQMRFGDRVSYTERLAPGSLSIPVLHFSIQPFIENAIIHGLEPKGTNGNIELVTTFSGKDMYIVMKDDGVGIAKEELGDIRERLERYSNTLTEEHIGIKNVHDQIRYYFGEAYGVKIDSELHHGTTITIRIPQR